MKIKNQENRMRPLDLTLRPIRSCYLLTYICIKKHATMEQLDNEMKYEIKIKYEIMNLIVEVGYRLCKAIRRIPKLILRACTVSLHALNYIFIF